MLVLIAGVLLNNSAEALTGPAYEKCVIKYCEKPKNG